MVNYALSVNNVSLTFGAGAGRTQALKDVSVAFEPRKLSLVMGHSGSGKTTLLSVLGCLTTPDSGEVHLMGRAVTGLPESEKVKLRRQHIGYVFQAFRLFRSLSAVENVMVAMEISGADKREARARAGRALDAVGLAHKRRLRPDELSGGEKQRVAIARSLVNDPPVILADEPTASLDSASGEQVAEILRRLAEEEGRTVVVVSHDERWLRYCHRTVTMRDGVLIRDEEGEQ
jgi:putative ABC transport system ATP-binding protein